jgi:hypothetical protein
MKRILLFFFLSVTIATAQNGGTIESRYGIGELDLMATARQRSMGGVTAGLTSSYDLSLTNPASWASVNELRLQGGFTYEYLSVSNADAGISSGAIKGFQFVLPLEESWRLRLATALVPISRSSYKTSTDGDVGGEAYTTTYTGSGGISQFRVGLALEALPHLTVGAAYQYYFGTIDQDWALKFENGTYFSAIQTRATSHSGSGILAGLQYDGIKGLTLGVSVQPAVEVRASRNLLPQYSTEDSTLSDGSGTQDIPLLVHAGASYQLSEKFLVAAEYSTQDWSEAIVFDRKQKQLGKMYKLGVGAEWYPYKDELGYRTLSRTAFRFGFYTQQPYLTLTDETSAEYFLTAGIGFPIFGASRGDFALEYGWRGKESDPLGTQDIIRASISISVGESWFKRKSD